MKQLRGKPTENDEKLSEDNNQPITNILYDNNIFMEGRNERMKKKIYHLIMKLKTGRIVDNMKNGERNRAGNANVVKICLHAHYYQ